MKKEKHYFFPISSFFMNSMHQLLLEHVCYFCKKVGSYRLKVGPQHYFLIKIEYFCPQIKIHAI